jgi:CheY-like chemotaxis protein
MNFSTILLVDDEPAHSTLVERNLRRGGIKNAIVKLLNGQEAMDWLTDNMSKLVESPLIFLDINMPVKGGMEVLSEIKSSEQTRHIPVVMLTTTDSPSEIKQCYDLGCNAYITKPLIQDEFMERVKKIGLFINMVSAPHLN